jgi:hypothetical protein
VYRKPDADVAADAVEHVLINFLAACDFEKRTIARALPSLVSTEKAFNNADLVGGS